MDDMLRDFVNSFYPSDRDDEDWKQNIQ
jgi:hypothetical protein